MKGHKRVTNIQLEAVVHAATSALHGTGVFASRRIAAGAYIGTFAGPEVRSDGVYVLWVYEPGRADEPTGRSGRNLLRYLNHAEPCNATFDGFDLYASKSIGRDEEITIDYGWAE